MAASAQLITLVVTTYFFFFLTRYLQNVELVCVCSEIDAWSCSIKKIFLKNYQNSQETPVLESLFLIELQALGMQLY